MQSQADGSTLGAPRESLFNRKLAELRLPIENHAKSMVKMNIHNKINPEGNDTPESAIKPQIQFNWRGNRPRMGKRSMCPLCGHLYHCAAGGLCGECGQRETVDLSYDDPPRN